MNKKKVVVLAAIIIAGIIIMIISFFANSNPKERYERMRKKYASILLDNKEDFDYVAEIMQQWPDISIIDLENGISSENQEIADEISDNEDFYRHLKNLHDLKKISHVVKLGGETEFQFTRPPMGYHGGIIYGEDLEADYFGRYKIDEYWFLDLIPNV